MAGILDSVNQRTQLVGQNRLELLLFKLRGRQRFGINVFKVREVLQCPPLTNMPKSNAYIHQNQIKFRQLFVTATHHARITERRIFHLLH